MLRRLALLLALATPACAPHDHPDEARLELARPLSLSPLVDSHEALGRVAAALQATPVADFEAEERTRYSDRLPPEREFYVTGPNKQAMTDYLRAAPELAAPPGYRFGFEADDRGRWQLHLLQLEDRLDLAAIAEASVVADDGGGDPRVLVRLRGEDGRAFHRLTERYLSRKIAVVQGDEVWMAPVVQEPISGGSFSISLGHTPHQTPAEAAAEALRRLLAP